MTTTDTTPCPTSDLANSSTTDLGSALGTTGLVAAVGNVLGDEAGDLLSAVAGAFEQMNWCEAEIASAQARHPQHADRVWHSFGLLAPNSRLERMRHEKVYRAHCREILERVAAGEDTRPGTAAEICCAMLGHTLLAPLTSAATGLYMRMYLAANLPHIHELVESSSHHEALQKTTIDDHEQVMRSKLADADRRLGAINCLGRHNSEEVDCVYAATEQLALEV